LSRKRDHAAILLSPVRSGSGFRRQYWQRSERFVRSAREALILADRLMMIFGFADRTSDFRRWTVDVTDEKQRSLVTVKFPINFPRGKRKAVANGGVRLLLQRLDAMIMRASPQLRPSGSEEDPAGRRVKSRRPERRQVRAH
jgi:hypothetical protein